MNSRKWIICVLLYAQISPAYCNELSTEALGLIPDTTLRKAVVDYYAAESEKDWVRTYAYRRKKFHRVVLFGDYLTTMNEGMKGWILDGIEIKEYRKGTYAFRDPVEVKFIDILFKEHTGSEYYLFGQLVRAENSEGDQQWSRSVTAWVLEDGAWRCLDCGFRGHLVLNMPMFLEK